MALLIVAPAMKTDKWAAELRTLSPQLDIRVWPETGNEDDIEFAMVWKHPPGELKRYANLNCIASLGVGVDHIFSDPDLPAGVPITRVVETSMAQSMSEYVTLAVLNHCRQFDTYRKDQSATRWQPEIPLLAAKVRIGIMGMGQLGSDAAKKLNHLGFQVAGWRRTPKKVDGVAIFAGDDQLDQFLAQTDILICLLPLTPATRNILNRITFQKLPKGAYVINVARGDHLVEEDLIEALYTKHLSGACLDVFRVEPLPPNHPFWNHPEVIVTPHISSLTYPKAVAPQIVENYQRLKAGKPLFNMVNVEAGY